MMNYRLHTPDGVKDYLPEEYAIKKQTENNVQSVFKRYGYSAIDTPTFEFIQVLDGVGGVSGERMYKLLDRDGSILGLRSDITPAIARVAATAYSSENIPMRFSYVGNCFRYNENYQGKLREFTQAGVELIGVNSVEADTEILIVAINTLLSAGLKDFRVDIGDVTFLQGVLEEADFSSEDCEKIREAIIDKNYVTVSQMVNEMDVEPKLKAIFNDLPLLIGDSTLIEQVRGYVNNEKSVMALEHLNKIYTMLSEVGLAEYISFDFSVIGHLDYYTGLVFRAYARGTGFSIVDGGRYDNLVKNFGVDYPAVGFAVKINDLLNALSNQNLKVETEKNIYLSYTSTAKLAALKTAEKLRKFNKNITMSVTESSCIDVCKAYIEENNFDTVYYLKDDTTVCIYSKSASTEINMTVAELIEKEATE